MLYSHYSLQVEPAHSTIKKVNKRIKKGKPLPTYEDYIKYDEEHKGLMLGGIRLLDKDSWDKLSIYRQYEEYKDFKKEYHWLVGGYIFFGLLVVGGMVGGIVYGIWIDDILQGILLALGFPIFIVAGFMGAGKGI